MNNTNKLITTTQSTASVPISKRTTSSTRADWLVPTALIVLSFIPFAAGAIRVVGLASGAEITPENARFFTAPLPVVLHIMGLQDLPWAALDVGVRHGLNRR